MKQEIHQYILIFVKYLFLCQSELAFLESLLVSSLKLLLSIIGGWTCGMLKDYNCIDFNGHIQ